MNDLKTLTRLCLLAILVTSSRAQAIEDPVDFLDEEVVSCNDESSLIRSDPALQEARETITNQFQGMNVEDSCVRNGLEFACRVDYRTFENNLEEVCESLGGRYFERDHTIECPTPSRKHILTVGNYPLCYGQDCKDSEVETLVETDIQELENIYSQNFEVTCTSKYDVDDGNVQCPDPVDATPEICSSMKSETVGFLCDCYDFCGGHIYACDGRLVGEKTGSCSRDLVSGCTFDLLAGRENKHSSSGNTKSLLLSYYMLALLALIGLAF